MVVLVELGEVTPPITAAMRMKALVAPLSAAFTSARSNLPRPGAQDGCSRTIRPTVAM